MSHDNLTATLLITCPDQKGLVATVTNMLASRKLNILDLHQHTARTDSRFFQRIKFDLSELEGSREALERDIGEMAARFQMEWKISYSDKKKRVAIFTSKYYHCIVDLLTRWQIGELNCDIPLIISNHEDQRALAETFNIPYHVFKITKDNKAEQEAKEIALLREYNIDLVVMARYMQILSDDFCAAFPHQIINIHHSTLPAFIGAKPYHQAFERGVKLVGATAHYATADLDEGPIIAQGVVDATHEDEVEDLVRKGRDVERIVLAKAVNAHLDDRIIVHGRGTVVF